MRSIRSSKRTNRRGGAAIEVALTAPLIFLVVFGLMEWARAENIRQIASTAAFNGARVGTLPGATTAEMEQRANDILDIYFVSSATVTGTISGTEATMHVSIPLGQNSWFIKRFFGNATVVRDFTLTL